MQGRGSGGGWVCEYYTVSERSVLAALATSSYLPLLSLLGLVIPETTPAVPEMIPFFSIKFVCDNNTSPDSPILHMI